MFYAIKTSLGEKIVESWDECVQFRDLAPSNAKFKKFSRIEDAQEFLRSLGEIGNAAKSGTPTAHPTSKPIPPEKKPVPSYKWACPHVIAYTDGSFNSGNGYWGYGVVIQDKQGRELSVYSGNGTEFASSRNVAGEVHGAIRAIQSAIQQGCQSILIFHDYEGISAWAEGRWKAKLPLTIWYKNKVDELRKQIDISFRWVPGHKGVAGNERADGLAKKACFGFDLQSS